MAADTQYPGGIHATTIEACNVVSEGQIQGGKLLQAANLVHLAQAIQPCEIVAGEIYAPSLVSGLQSIADHMGDIRKEIRALCPKVDAAAAA